MRKINWQPKGSGISASTKIGCIDLCCRHFHSKSEWRARVVINNDWRFRASSLRYGPIRKSLSRAKEDAIRLAREMLLDYQAGLAVEMKNFDLLE